MNPALAAKADLCSIRVHPPELHRRDHVLAVDLDDKRHTHTEFPAGPTVLALVHNDQEHVTTVALLVGFGASDEAWRSWPDSAWLTVYRPDTKGGVR